MPDHMTLDPICFCRIFLSLGKRRTTDSGWQPLIVPQYRCLPKTVVHRRISTASLVGGREEVSLSPGKYLRALSCRKQFHALRVSLVFLHRAAACPLLLPGNCICCPDILLSRFDQLISSSVPQLFGPECRSEG